MQAKAVGREGTPMVAALGILDTWTEEVLLYGLLAVYLIQAVLACKVAGKAGFNAALGLITLVPLGVLIYLAILAFVRWPAWGPVPAEDEEAAGVS